MARSEAASPVSPGRAEARELASLKRGREGSIEPSQSGSQPSLSTLATKKNRLEPTTENEASPTRPAAVASSQVASSLKAPSGIKGAEAKNVKEVRRKVEKMNWKEGDAEPEDEADTEIVGEDQSTSMDPAHSGDGLKRKTLDRSESAAKVDSGEKLKRPKDTPSPPPSGPIETAVPAPAAKKPQSTFGAYSTKASPFASAGGSSSPFASASVTSAPVKSAFSGSAFGGYSSTASPFAKKAGKEGQSGDVEPEAEKQASSSFGEILKESKADVKDEEEKLRMSEQDVHTGEEDEETIYQTRTKLYVMQDDGGWRERGVGTLKLNVRASDGKGARLVMRAEGVLRLILNVSLYVGMSCLEDGKHVRMTVFEGKQRQFITFRTGSAKAASELCGNIHDHIPFESTPGPRSATPETAATKSAV